MKGDDCGIEGIGERQPLAMPSWREAREALEFIHLDTVPVQSRSVGQSVSQCGECAAALPVKGYLFSLGE